MIQFHETSRGVQFYEGTLPRLVQSLDSISDRLDKLITILEEDGNNNRRIGEPNKLPTDSGTHSDDGTDDPVDGASSSAE